MTRAHKIHENGRPTAQVRKAVIAGCLASDAVFVSLKDVIGQESDK